MYGVASGVRMPVLALLAGEGAQTAGADVATAVLSIDQHALALDIGAEHTVRRALGVTYIVPEHRGLSTDLTFSHDPPLFFDDWVMIPQRMGDATEGGAMGDHLEARGKIEVTQAAIASIVSEAVQTCYGVVGTVPRNFATGLADILSTDRKRGVEVVVRDDRIVVDLYLVVEYGARISSVAESIKHVVKYQVERALELPVEQVNVHVQALRVSDMD